MLSFKFLLVATFLIASTLVVGQMSTGGWTEKNVGDKDVKALAGKAVTKLNAQSNDMFYQFPVEILGAKSQVVAGIQYELKILVGKSSCKKNQVGSGEFDAANCKETSENDRKVVTARIWIKEWENFEEIEFIDTPE